MGISGDACAQPLCPPNGECGLQPCRTVLPESWESWSGGRARILAIKLATCKDFLAVRCCRALTRGGWNVCRHLRKCIIDKNARIGRDVKLINKGGVMEANHEADGFIVKDGIIVVIKDAAIKAGFEF